MLLIIMCLFYLYIMYIECVLGEHKAWFVAWILHTEAGIDPRQATEETKGNSFDVKGQTEEKIP